MTDQPNRTDEAYAAEVAWLLDRAKEIDPGAWAPPFQSRLAARRIDAVKKAKDEWDARHAG